MSNASTPDHHATAEELVKRGYEKVTGSKPSRSDLDALTSRQIKRFYKAGSKKKPSNRRKLWFLLFAIPVAILSVLTFRYFQQADDSYSPSKSASVWESGTNFSVNRSPGSSPSQPPDSSNTSNPNTSSTSDSLNASTNNKTYTASKCTTETIPHGYVTKEVSYLKIGETMKYPGLNGRRYVCTADSNGEGAQDSTVPPMDELTYIGTGSTTTTNPAPTYTYEQALSYAQSNCNFAYNTSSYQPCVSAYLKKYGY
jgi:hypothetical protein